jgi:hypothetical protein
VKNKSLTHTAIKKRSKQSDATKTKKITSSNRTKTRTSRSDHTKTRTRITKSDEKQKSKDGNNTFKKILVASIAVVAFAHFKPDSFSRLTGFDPSVLTSEVKQSINKENETNDASSFIQLENIDPLMEVTLNGKKIGYGSEELGVEVGKKIKIQVSKKGYFSYTTTVQVDEPGELAYVDIPDLEVARLGQLSTSKNYDGAFMVVKIRGKQSRIKLPATGKRFPAGLYKAKIISEDRGIEKDVEFIIRENERSMLK